MQRVMRYHVILFVFFNNILPEGVVVVVGSVAVDAAVGAAASAA